MKNTPHQPVAISYPTPASLSDHYSDYLLFFLENRCEMSALKKQFSLTSRQVLEFLASREVREMLEALQESVRLAFAVGAQKSRDFAIATMKTVCLDLIRQTSIPASGIADETAHAKAVNHLRLATAQLGRLAAATIAPPKTVRKPELPAKFEHLIPSSEPVQTAVKPKPSNNEPRVNGDDSSLLHSNGIAFASPAQT